MSGQVRAKTVFLKRIKLLLFISIVILLANGCTASKKSVGLAPGNLAPEFAIPDLQNNIHQLKDFRGKTVLLNFWASWCMPCIEEVPYLNSLHEKIAGSNVEIVAIAVDDLPVDVERFCKENNIKFTVLLDRNSEVSRDYKIKGFPETYLIDSAGKIKMITDDSNGVPTAKVSGPRHWSNQFFINQLK